MERAWINVPSRHNPLYKYNGRNVLVAPEPADLSSSHRSTSVTVYFTKGETVSMSIPRNALSLGWVDERELPAPLTRMQQCEADWVLLTAGCDVTPFAAFQAGYREGYLQGFMKTGEGFNFEYPYENDQARLRREAQGWEL